jgi:exopolyphosphatase/pppGpp-phosphohydrolase
VILDTVVEELGLPALTVSDWGLREGVILEAFGGGE